jgi:hypothetical protein
VGLVNPHLDDAAFAEIWTGRTIAGAAPSDAGAERHLDTCGDCRVRYAAFREWLEQMRDEAVAEADDVFGPERLAAQQAAITRRLEGLEHPARVLAFPRFARPIATDQPLGRRWIAAAAAAGLIVGLGLGQVLEFSRATPAPRQAETATTERQLARGTPPATDAVRLGVTPAVSQISDEDFLDDHELAQSQARVPESLQYLNAITPLSRDLDPR